MLERLKYLLSPIIVPALLCCLALGPAMPAFANPKAEQSGEPEEVPFSGQINLIRWIESMFKGIWEEPNPLENPEDWSEFFALVAPFVFFKAYNDWTKARTGRREMKEQFKIALNKVKEMEEAVRDKYASQVSSLERDLRRWSDSIEDMKKHMNIEKLSVLFPQSRDDEALKQAINSFRENGSTREFNLWLRETENGLKFRQEHGVWIETYHKLDSEAQLSKRNLADNFSLFTETLASATDDPATRLDLRPYQLGDTKEQPGAFMKFDNETHASVPIRPNGHDIRARTSSYCASVFKQLNQNAADLKHKSSFRGYWSQWSSIRDMTKSGTFFAGVLGGFHYLRERARTLNDGKDLFEIRDEKKELADLAKTLPSKVTSHEGRQQFGFFHTIVKAELKAVKPAVLEALTEKYSLTGMELSELEKMLTFFDDPQFLMGPSELALIKAAKETEQPNIESIVALLNSKDKKGQAFVVSRFLDAYYTDLLQTLTGKISVELQTVTDEKGKPFFGADINTTELLPLGIKKQLIEETLKTLPTHEVGKSKLSTPGSEPNENPTGKAPTAQHETTDLLSPVNDSVSQTETRKTVDEKIVYNVQTSSNTRSDSAP